LQPEVCPSKLARLTVGALIASLLSLGVAAVPASADSGVGVDTYLALGGNELDAGFEQVLQSVLDSQFAGVEATVEDGRLILSGYASPGVHSVVLAIVGNLLQNPIPVPVELDVVTPNLGLDLPFVDTGVDLEIPDLSGILDVLGVVDRIHTVR
jgi:hypothetical protein